MNHKITIEFHIVKDTATFNLASAAGSLTTSTPNRQWILDSVEIKATGSLNGQTFTIDRDDGNGATYDSGLYTSGALGAVTSVFYAPTGRHVIEKDDEIVVGLTNSATPAVTGTISVRGHEV